MTWLRGSTDTTNAKQDLYNLLSGATAASNRGSGQGGNGAQATTDAWTGFDATNFVLRSTATVKPLFLNVAMYRGMPRFSYSTNDPGVAYDIQTGKPTFSGIYSGTGPRAYFMLYVSTVNTAGGNLTGLVVTWSLNNADTNAAIGSGTVSGWSGTSDTKLISAGISLTLTAPAGQFATGSTTAIRWVRGYTTTQTQGVDYNPDVPRRKATTMVLSSTSAGSNNYTDATDYDVVGFNGFPNPGSGFADSSSYHSAQTQSGCLHGIHWKTTGTIPAVGATYYMVDMDMYAAYAKLLFLNSNEFHITTTDFHDSTNNRGRNQNDGLDNFGSYRVTFTATQGTFQVFTGAPTGTPYINYWISVKSDKIIVVMRGDPAQATATTGFWTLQKYTPVTAWTSADIWPWVTWASGTAFMFSVAAIGKPMYGSTGYWGQPPANILNKQGFPVCSWSTPNAPMGAMEPSGLSAINPNSADSKWWFWTIGLSDKTNGLNPSGSGYDYSSPGGPRGKLRGVYIVQNYGFAHLDEAVDTIGGGTYLLLSVSTSKPTGLTNTAVAVFEE